MIDPVHDIQKAFRRLVSAYSFPGTPFKLVPDDLTTGFSGRIHPAIAVLAMIFLDGEVTAYFHEMEEDDILLLKQICRSPSAGPETADFLFFANAEDCGQSKISAVSKAKTGNLADPHEGADVILAVDKLPAELKGPVAANGKTLTLSGPGLEKKKILVCRDPEKNDFWWVEARNKLCREFPLGIEVTLVDKQSNVMAIPRSTKAVLSTPGRDN